MRTPTLLLILAVGAAYLFTTAGSYIQPTGTQVTYVFCDSLAPHATYEGIADTQISGGTTRSKTNYGASTTFRVGFSSVAAGINRGLMRHNPFTHIDSTQVASWDSVTLDATVVFTTPAAPNLDTLLVCTLLNYRWVEGVGLGVAASDTLGVTGTCYNQRTASAVDSLWRLFRAAGAESLARMNSIAGAKLDSLCRGYSLDADRDWGGLDIDGSYDRAPYPSASFAYNTTTLTGNPVILHMNLGDGVLWQLRQNKPLNVLLALKCDTTGRGGNPDSLDKLDVTTGEQGAGAGPKFTYYVRLKRTPPVVGRR